jgi:hypothetical protein
MVTKVKPNINSVKVHPQLNDNGHPVDGELVGGAGSLCPGWVGLVLNLMIGLLGTRSRWILYQITLESDNKQ